MRLTRTRIAVALTLACSILGSTTAGAAQPEAIDSPSDSLTPAWAPPGLSQAPVTVVLQMQGDTVAERQGAAGRKLSAAEKASIKNSLRAQQERLRAAIESRGGTVLATYQVAYNGIKVRVSRDKLASLARLPGVIAVRPLQLQTPGNVRGVSLIGTPAVWQNTGLRGEGVKIAIIDTGIDYTHATFGGPGTAAAYASARAAETSPANPAWFGPGAPRVKGGIDLVGDSYNANPSSPTYQPIPHPDPNPLDCNGHGSHVAGTAAGSGVTSAGATYTGPYDAATLATPSNFRVGPGVAPKADLYAVRVFGCAGSTDVTVDAIEWSVDNDMDVINMSLGSPFGLASDPSAVASTNAAKAGVIVVASAGNSGANQYITGAPGVAEGAISTAANDPTPSFPGALIGLTTGPVQSINANGASPMPAGSLPVKVLRTPSGGISLGCNPAEYVDVTNKIVVTMRGTCARVARAVFGQQAGAAAVVMVNTDAGFPPFEGQITGNPDTGEQYTVTIPFLGVPSTRATVMNNANGTSATLTANLITNPSYQAFASFSSGGPRSGDSHLKPDITAPGVSIVSAGVGSGNGASTLSGTSMASPHAAGVAALTRQAHPTWRAEDIKSAIVHTANPAGVANYRTSRGGAGLVQPAASVATQVVARTSGGKFGAALNFGFAEFKTPYSRTLEVTLRNNGGSSATFDVAQARPSGSPHTIGLSASSVTVPAGGEATVSVTLNVPQGTAGSSSGAALSFREVAGLVEFTPQAGGNGGVTLRVPYYLVPRVQAEVSTTLGEFSGGSAVATVSNKDSAAIAGTADFYAWGLSSPKSSDPGNVYNDVRAVGVQSFPSSATSATLVFAVNTWNRWSSPSSNEFDIYVDVDNDGSPDYIVVGVDQGAVQTGTFNGRMASFVFSTRSAGASVLFFAVAPTDASTALLPVASSQLCRTGEPCLSGGPISYQVVSFDLLNGGAKEVAGAARFHPWNSAVSTGNFVSVAPGASASTTVTVNAAQQAATPALGLMVVTSDNKAGADEAQLIPLR